jgi:protein-S-isoprenylcysteine O-methyltransferase Ste14
VNTFTAAVVYTVMPLPASRILTFLPIAVFLWMIVGATRVFTRSRGDFENPRGFGVSLSIWGPLASMQLAGEPTLWMAVTGVAGLGLSLALFQWASRSIRGRTFSLAGNTDVPQFVHTAGPYAYIRNPFYASYLLAGVSTVVTWPNLWGGIAVLLSFVYYQWLARFEEGKFARSPVAEEYARYKARTGRLLPRLSR